MPRFFAIILVAALLAGCTPTTLNNGPSAGHLRAEDVTERPGSIPQTVQQSIPLPPPKATEKTETYSVVVHNISVQDLLFALARDARLNVDIHPGISGYVTLNAIDQTLPQLLNRIAKQADMRFELDGPNLAVMPDAPYLKHYRVDYINLSREVTGTISTNTQISTSALSTSGITTANNDNISRIQIENKSKNHFWESLEKNLKDLLHETDKIFPEGSTETVIEESTAQSTTGTSSRVTGGGSSIRSGQAVQQTLVSGQAPATTQNSGASVIRQMTFREAASVIINPETGVIAVRATSRQHEKVQEFIDRIMRSARRQVMIEATIIEVNLNDNYQHGIDWTKADTLTGFTLTRASNTQTAGSTVAPFQMVYRNISRGLDVFVDMLRGFGTTKVLSSPKLTVLNNQTATLKVSEDFVYFNVKQDVATSINTNPIATTTTTPQSVSIGFFMSLTAQISDDDVVTLNVRPSISSISALKQDPNPALTVANEVPQIRTREIESMMRVQSGDVAVLGGLMEDRMENRSGRFPVLGDVPVLGEIFTTRNNASTKTELVVVLRPTVIKEASIHGDFSHLRSSLPSEDFFETDEVYHPFSGPNQLQEPLK